MFIPSEYSGTSSFAINNDSCEKYKKYRKKYLKKMWATPIFTKERQAYEHKANAAHANYLSCKEAGGAKSLSKMTKKITGKKSTAKTSENILVPAEADAAAADAAAAAAEEAGGGNLPVVAFGLVALLIVGGGAFFLFKGKKKKKKKKLGLPGGTEKHLPRELAPTPA